MSNRAKSTIFGAAAVSAAATLTFYLYKQLSKNRQLKRKELYGRPIYVVSSCEEFARLVRQYDLLDETVIGLDAEWTRNCPLSIVQLSFRNINIILQVERLESVPPPYLNELMKNPEILKTGVGIHEDAKRILQYLVVDEINGIVDLADVAHHMGHTDLKTSLQYLTEKYLKILISKDPEVRCGNWDIQELDEEQTVYAASDSYFSRELFIYFYNKYIEASDQEPLSAWEWAALNHLDKSLEEFTNGNKVRVKIIDQKGVHYSNIDPAIISGIKTGGYSKRKHPVYEDCQLLSPDGVLLCLTSQKKLDWYVRKGLGKIVGQNPYTVQLNFQPKGQKEVNVSSIDNMCVVCGKKTDYVSHSIVPHKYRRYLPEKWKSHNNHDNVVLCIPCSIRCNKYDDIYSRRILESHGLHSNSIAVVYNMEIVHAQKTASVLLRIYNHEISPPTERKIALEKDFLAFLQKNNPNLWMPLETASDKTMYEIVDEKEYYRRINNPSDSEAEEMIPVEEEMTPVEKEEMTPVEVPHVENPYSHTEIERSPDAENIDRAILTKVFKLSSYSVDSNYVSPEEKVMQDILSQENVAISFYIGRKGFLIGYEAATTFVIGWRQHFMNVILQNAM